MKKVLADSQIISLVKATIQELFLDDGNHSTDNTKARFYGNQHNPTRVIIAHHGLTASTAQIDGFCRQLSQKDPNTLIVSMPLPGHSFEGYPGSFFSHYYDEHSQGVADLIDKIHNTLGLPCHILGVSAGGTMTSSIATKSGHVASMILMAPYYFPQSIAGRIAFSLGHYFQAPYFKPLSFLYDAKSYDIGDPSIPDGPELPTTVGSCFSNNEFAWRTYDALNTVRVSAQNIRVFLAKDDPIVHNPTSKKAAGLMGVTPEVLSDFDHAMLCHIRHKPEQLGGLIDRAWSNIVSSES